MNLKRRRPLVEKSFLCYRFIEALRRKLQWLVAAEIVVVTMVAAFLTPGGGMDLYYYYRPLAEGCLECGFTPWYASWVLYPIRLIPYPALWPIWVGITLICLIWVNRRLGASMAVVLLSFPTLGLVWLGQIDGLIMLGLALALTARHATIRGVGLLLMSIKPQVSGIAILILLWYERERLKALLVPGLVLLASLSTWGIAGRCAGLLLVLPYPTMLGRWPASTPMGC